MVNPVHVLILVVLEDAIGVNKKDMKVFSFDGLNPCCAGRCYRSCVIRYHYKEQ